MNNSFKLAALAGAMSMALSGVASAAPTFLYDGWTVNGGTINENAGGMCASSLYTCSVIASGSGFKQINVSEVADASSGTSYIMTIVTDQNATTNADPGIALGFSDVSFVKMNLTLGGNSGGESGITARQSINETVGGKVFVSTTNINTGWAATADAANIVINQQLSDDGKLSGFTGDDFSSDFFYRSTNDAVTGERTGFEMSIDQVARLASAATEIDPVTNLPVAAASVNDVQAFALREKQGSFLASGSSLSTSNPNGIDLVANDGVAPITWNGDGTAAGDDIKAIWIGQEINLGSTADVGFGSLGSSFGYVSFENVSAEKVDSAFGFSDTNSGSAWKWDEAFYVGGDAAAPILPAP